MQCNDGYQRIGAEDGLMFGSVHPLMALELCVWLVKTNFKVQIREQVFRPLSRERILKNCLPERVTPSDPPPFAFRLPA